MNALSFLATVGNAIKGIYNGIKANLMAVENPGYGIEIAKEKVKNFFKTVLKTFVYQILFYALILVIVIAAVGVIFEIFAFFKNLTDPFDINVGEMKEWANELSDEEIKEMQEYGASIHPQKIERYLEIEENSYPKNVTIKTPITTKVWENGELVIDEKKYIDYLLKRGDTAYPYRQWWQSTAVLDTINDTAINKRKWEIVDDAERDLKPVFKWLNPLVPKMKEGSVYKEGSGAELVITTKIETVEREFPLDFEGEVITNITEEEIKEYYPLAYLEEVETMFANYKFEYIPDATSSGDGYNDSYITVKTVTVTGKDGKPKTVNVKYRVDVHVNIVTVIEDMALVNMTKEFVDRFLVFLDDHNIDINSDPEVMYFMAEQMPQNYDFLNEFAEYLYYIDDMVLYGEFRVFQGYAGNMKFFHQT